MEIEDLLNILVLYGYKIHISYKHFTELHCE